MATAEVGLLPTVTNMADDQQSVGQGVTGLARVKKVSESSGFQRRLYALSFRNRACLPHMNLNFKVAVFSEGERHVGTAVRGATSASDMPIVRA